MTRTDLRFPCGRAATWPEIRVWVLNRDGHVCAECGDEATEVDHIWPRRWGGNDASTNLRAICGPCNKAKGSSIDIDEASDAQLVAGLLATKERIGAEMSTTGPTFDLLFELMMRSKRRDDDLFANTVKLLISCFEVEIRYLQGWLSEPEVAGLSPLDVGGPPFSLLDPDPEGSAL